MTEIYHDEYRHLTALDRQAIRALEDTLKTLPAGEAALAESPRYRYEISARHHNQRGQFLMQRYNKSNGKEYDILFTFIPDGMRGLARYHFIRTHHEKTFASSEIIKWEQIEGHAAYRLLRDCDGRALLLEFWQENASGEWDTYTNHSYGGIFCDIVQTQEEKDAARRQVKEARTQYTCKHWEPVEKWLAALKAETKDQALLSDPMTPEHHAAATALLRKQCEIHAEAFHWVGMSHTCLACWTHEGKHYVAEHENGAFFPLKSFPTLTEAMNEYSALNNHRLTD